MFKGSLQKSYSFVAAILVIVAVSTLSYSHTRADQTTVSTIEVIGNERTEKPTILSYISLKKGSTYTQERADESIKTLYTTGFFSKININFKNGILTINVSENPIINEVDFVGNSALKTEVLSQELLSKTREFFSKSKLSNDVSRLLDIYNKSGRFATKIVPQLAKLPQNRINILFNIEEGKKSTIKKIVFVGNNHFPDSELKSQIMSKEDKIYNIFRANYYDTDIVEYDRVLLTKFYNYHGYANFKMISATADIIPGSSNFYLTFSIEEGEKYNFGKLTLTNEISQIPNQEILDLISIQEGKLFNSKLIEDSTQEVTKYFAVHGYPFVEIKTNYDLDKENKVVNIDYSISKSPKIYVGRININGNLKTYDTVIRRELKLADGDPYNSFLIEQSEQRLRNLDFFEKATIEASKTSKPDVVDLAVDIEEKSTASLNFSVGYSTSEGPIGMIGFTEKNLLGQGKKLGINVQKSPSVQSAGFSLTQPNFLQSSIDAGVSVKASSQNNTTSSFGAQANSIPFTSRTLATSVFINYDITDYLAHSINYSLSNDTIGNVVQGSAEIVNEQVGRNIVSSVGHNLVYNTTDSRSNPTTGYAINLVQVLAGLGGDSNFVKNVLEGSYYYPLTDDITIKLGASLGDIHSLGSFVRINENFTLGGYSLRGFDYSGVGPRDKGTNQDALGGKTYYTGTIEAKFAIPVVPKDAELSGAVFSDMGSIWDIDIPNRSNYTKANFYNDKTLRASVGVGLVWITKVGPFRVDFARAIRKEKYDQLRPFLFSFASLF